MGDNGNWANAGWDVPGSTFFPVLQCGFQGEALVVMCSAFSMFVSEPVGFRSGSAVIAGRVGSLRVGWSTWEDSETGWLACCGDSCEWSTSVG